MYKLNYAGPTLEYPNIAQLVERPTVDGCSYRAVPGSNPGVRIAFYFSQSMPLALVVVLTGY